MQLAGCGAPASAAHAHGPQCRGKRVERGAIWGLRQCAQCCAASAERFASFPARAAQRLASGAARAAVLRAWRAIRCRNLVRRTANRRLLRLPASSDAGGRGGSGDGWRRQGSKHPWRLSCAPSLRKQTAVRCCKVTVSCWLPAWTGCCHLLPDAVL